MKILNLLFLLIISPLLGEMLSGATPPEEWLNPAISFIMISFYGGGTILIREAKVKWQTQWSVILLAMAYGIVEEGIMMQSFFNHNHEGLDKLAGYGMLFGVQWPWTIMLIIYHATISTLIPILMAEFLWPEFRNQALLGKKGITIAVLGFILPTVSIMIFIWSIQGRFSIPYYPNFVLLCGSVLIVILLILFAYKLRKSRITSRKVLVCSPAVFAFSGFCIQLVNLLFPFIMASLEMNAFITVLFQLTGVAMFTLFLKNEFLHENCMIRHKIFFVSGSILAFISITPIQEFSNGLTGMINVGVVFLVFLILWIKLSLKRNVWSIK